MLDFVHYFYTTVKYLHRLLTSESRWSIRTDNYNNINVVLFICLITYARPSTENVRNTSF